MVSTDRWGTDHVLGTGVGGVLGTGEADPHVLVSFPGREEPTGLQAWFRGQRVAGRGAEPSTMPVTQGDFGLSLGR